MVRPGRDWYLPTFTRLRRRGHDPKRFADRRAWPWLAFGGGALVALIVLTVAWTAGGAVLERVATILALYFFLVAVSAWAGLGARAPWVALAAVALLYGASFATRLVDLHDLFLLSLIVGLLLFVLAGFNLLFVLEEVIYDAHRLMRLRSPWWAALSAAVSVGLVIVLPLADAAVGLHAPSLHAAAIGASMLLAVVWAVRFAGRTSMAVVREADLLVAGLLAGAGLADLVGLLRGTTGLVPSIVAYAAIVGTWLYVSFTTLQRAQYFMRAADVVPWTAVLLSSGFAVLAHVHSQYRLSGALAFPDLVNVRVGYLLLGLWLGLAFFVLRGLWRILVFIRDERSLGTGTRRVAGSLARLTEEVLTSEQRAARVTWRAIGALDRVVPGRRARPTPPPPRPLDVREGGAVQLQGSSTLVWPRPRAVVDDSVDDSEDDGVGDSEE